MRQWKSRWLLMTCELLEECIEIEKSSKRVDKTNLLKITFYLLPNNQMKNWKYTVFYLPKWAPERAEDLRIETENIEKYLKAMKYAKDHDIQITRIYEPKTEIKKPDFVNVF